MNQLEHMMTATDMVLNPMPDAEMERRSKDLAEDREEDFLVGKDKEDDFSWEVTEDD